MTHAIIMGGSIAGLCAAAALARNFDRVTVIERDPEPGPEARRGTPQGHHVHALLSRGRAIMNDLFPGAFDALARDGAVRADVGTIFRWFQFGGWKVNTPVGVEAWFQSRPLLEHHLRQSLARNPKVELRFGVAVDQPVHTDGHVRGLRLRDGSVLEADLTVDATGRGSRSAIWLDQWGYGAVPEQKVRVGLAYVSGVFEPTKGSASKRCLAIYQHAPTGNKRTGFCSPLEHGRKVVTLVGYHGDHAPTEIGAFREWAKTLLRPELAEELAGLELVGELHKYNYPEQYRRCYGRMRRLPERYLIIGDAMCSFDPTFGQGMTIVAIQAEQLARDARPHRSTTRLQRQLYRLTNLPFSMTSNEAHRWSETSGWKPPLSRLQQSYIGRVFDAANRDPEVYRTLMRVTHLVSPPTALFRPSMVLRVLGGKTRQPELAKPTSPFAGELSSSAVTQTGY
jgi:2-polyprenyl-6-methoxyphenol hydroxylase-like FAD-dependent oxidoreductase